jgi:alpha-1,6-mannosyltransferase
MIIFSDLIYKQYTLLEAIKTFLKAFCSSLAVTLVVDSYFWKKSLFWPELQVFLFNTLKNGSVHYGISPWYSYFLVLLPRISLLAYGGALMALLTRRQYVFRLLTPCFAYVFLYSFLPHKEWRFIMYILSPLGIAASQFVVSLSPRYKTLFKFLLLGNFFVSFGFLLISSYNYPGGYAMILVQKDSSPTYIHIDIYTAMNGVSRFSQSCPSVPYPFQKSSCTIEFSKNETLKNFSDFSHLLTHEPQKHKDFEIIDVVKGFAGVQKRFSFREWVEAIKQLHWQPFVELFIRLEPKVWILKNKK